MAEITRLICFFPKNSLLPFAAFFKFFDGFYQKISERCGNLL